MAMLEATIPGSGETVEMDIGQLDPNGPEVKALFQKLQEQRAPTPFQNLMKQAAPPAAAARDAATGLVSESLKGQFAPMEGPLNLPTTPFQPAKKEAEAQGIRQTGQWLAPAAARVIVPQTPGEFVERLATTALTGGAGAGIGILGSAGTKVGGALTRAVVPGMLKGLTEIIVEDGKHPLESVVASIVPALATEGVWGALTKLTSRSVLFEKVRDKAGQLFTGTLGEQLDHISSVRGLRTPYDYDTNLKSWSGKPWDTKFQARINAAIDKSQEEIERGLAPAIAKLPPTDQKVAMENLEDMTGVTPKKTWAPGSPLQSQPTVRVGPVDTPAELFKKGLQKLREKFEAADKMDKGAEQYAAFQEYKLMREKMESHLAFIDPTFQVKYDAMNQQYKKDMDIRDWLWKMHKAGSWETTQTGTHTNLDKFGKEFADGFQLFEREGMFGGGDQALKVLAGDAPPGARPRESEEFFRVFRQFPLSLSGSVGLNPTLTSLPEGLLPPVPSAAARGASDLLTQMGSGSMIRSMYPDGEKKP